MKLLLPVAFIFMVFESHAQNYTRDTGIRFSEFITITYRQYQDYDQALEGMLHAGRHRLTFTVMKEYFQPFTARVSDNLFFIYGFGGHAGFGIYDHYRIINRVYVLDENHFTPLLGVDGLVGLEYRFREFPFLIGIDIKPNFEYSIIQYFSLYVSNVGFSLKYKF